VNTTHSFEETVTKTISFEDVYEMEYDEFVSRYVPSKKEPIAFRPAQAGDQFVACEELRHKVFIAGMNGDQECPRLIVRDKQKKRVLVCELVVNEDAIRNGFEYVSPEFAEENSRKYPKSYRIEEREQ
jgi:hypothetical protein